MAIRKEMVELYRKYATLDRKHDWDINIISTIKNGLYFYNDALTYYRLHDSNTIGMSKPTNIWDRVISAFNIWRDYVMAQNYRLTVYNKMILESDNVRVINDFKNIEKFVRYRYKVFIDRSIITWIKELKATKPLAGYLDMKGLIVDLMFVFRLDKIINRSH